MTEREEAYLRAMSRDLGALIEIARELRDECGIPSMLSREEIDAILDAAEEHDALRARVEELEAALQAVSVDLRGGHREIARRALALERSDG